MGITKTRITAYQPQCDGQVERQNRTLQDMLAAFCNEDENDRDLWIDAAVLAYNLSLQDPHETSLYEIVFGLTPHTSVRNIIRTPTERSQYAIRMHSVPKADIEGS